MRALNLAFTLAVGMLCFAKAPSAIAQEGPIPSFDGFYIGGHAGWLGVDQGATVNPLPAGFGVPAVGGGGLAGGGFLAVTHSLNSDSFSGGFQIGHNWQFGRTVFGTEVDLTFFDRNETSTVTAPDTCCAGAGTATNTLSAKNDWVTSARGRIGYTFGNWMVHAAGGVAITETKYSSFLTPDGLAFPGGSSAVSAKKKTQVGGVIGVGGEALLGGNWLLRAEYDLYFFPGTSAIAPVVGVACPGCRFDIKYSALLLHTFRVGLAYKF